MFEDREKEAQDWQALLTGLEMPFPLDQVQWRAMDVDSNSGQARAVAYVDARTVRNRLDRVVPGHWSFVTAPMETMAELRTVVCQGTLTVLGQSRSDVGEGGWFDNERGPTDAWKTAVSDCFKRCAVQFGIAAYLYRLPFVTVGWSKYEGIDLAGIPAMPDWALPAGPLQTMIGETQDTCWWGPPHGVASDDVRLPAKAGVKSGHQADQERWGLLEIPDAACSNEWAGDTEARGTFGQRLMGLGLTDTASLAILGYMSGYAIDDFGQYPGDMRDALNDLSTMQRLLKKDTDEQLAKAIGIA